MPYNYKPEMGGAGAGYLGIGQMGGFGSGAGAGVGPHPAEGGGSGSEGLPYGRMRRRVGHGRGMRPMNRRPNPGLHRAMTRMGARPGMMPQ